MILLIDGVRYELHKPSNEDELEREVKQHIEELFGKDCLPFDKQKIKSLSGIGTIPDIFVLSLPDKWYIVEVELSTHPIYDHIVSQVTKFMNAYGNPPTKGKLVDGFYTSITANKVTEAKVKESIGSEEIYKFISDLISHPPSLVIIIEERTQELEEACEALAWQPKIVEFKTFRREDAPEVHAHLFEPVVEIVKRPIEVIKPPPVKPIGGFTLPPTGKVEIRLRNIHTPRKFGLIPFYLRESPEVRDFFPGYKISFILETDIGGIKSSVTSAPNGTPIGDPRAGKYIQGNLKPWYEAHPELKEGDVLVIEEIEPKKRYSLSIKR
jgi:hypothetical protein